MLGGCLSPLANLLPYCHESHPWKSLSLSLVSLSFFHGLSHALHLPSRQSSCLFPLIYPPPLRVTSPSFIARVTAFRRSNHEIISRYSSLSVGLRAAAFFSKFLILLEIFPFFCAHPFESNRNRLEAIYRRIEFSYYLNDSYTWNYLERNAKITNFQNSICSFVKLVRFSVNKNPNMFQNTFQKYFYPGNDKKTCQILIVHSMKEKEIKNEIKKIGNRSFPWKKNAT